MASGLFGAEQRDLCLISRNEGPGATPDITYVILATLLVSSGFYNKIL